jgi:hypothetical protein
MPSVVAFSSVPVVEVAKVAEAVKVAEGAASTIAEAGGRRVRRPALSKIAFGWKRRAKST